MKIDKRPTGLVAAAVATAMLLSACGGGDDGGSGSGGGDGGTFTAYIGEPKSPLVPGNTTESEGAKVIAALWTGLVGYSEEGEVEYTGVAESIESDDNQNWTITLKDGWTFHDGTPVDAQSFVDAWNYTANPQNAQDGGSYLSRIAGYQELQDGAATELSGLAVTDDLTFTVQLSTPFALFPAVVGYDAFNPLPDVFFEDPAAFGTNPVGNGPFQADSEFVPGQGITLTRYDDYAGDDAAQAEGMEFVVYADQATAYTDAQDGNVDIVDVIPPDVIESAQSEFGDNFINTEVSQITYLGFPTYDQRYSDPRVRQAFSMAIDRDAISEAIFSGTRTAADSFISPVVDGYREGACEYCTLDVDRANQLLDEAGFDRSQPIDLWFNTGGGHDAWVEAVGNQLRQNLGVDFQLRGDLDLAQYLPVGESRGFTGPFRYGWSFDYPAAESYLTPLLTPQSFPPTGSNYAFYDNPQVTDLIAQGDQAPSEQEAIELYQQAEDLVAEDMPIAPLFFTQIQTVHTDNVDNVRIDLFQRPVWSEVTVN
ncbi:peptide ABC transporter substrate-binding protein [Blastococcus sp. SYSU D00695]